MEKITHTIITTSSTDKVLKDATDAALNKVKDDVNRIIPEDHRNAIDQFIDKDSDVSLDRLKGFLK